MSEYYKINVDCVNFAEDAQGNMEINNDWDESPSNIFKKKEDAIKYIKNNYDLEGAEQFEDDLISLFRVDREDGKDYDVEMHISILHITSNPVEFTVEELK